jgi:hypothetical protein
VPPPAAELRLPPEVRLHSEFDLDIDPVTYQVLRNRFWSINLDHSDTIRRVSGSPVIVYMDDFNTALLTETADLLMAGPSIQWFAALGDLPVKWTMENRGQNPGIGEGDVFFHNDPWIGCTHPMDPSPAGIPGAEPEAADRLASGAVGEDRDIALERPSVVDHASVAISNAARIAASSVTSPGKAKARCDGRSADSRSAAPFGKSEAPSELLGDNDRILRRRGEMAAPRDLVSDGRDNRGGCVALHHRAKSVVKSIIRLPSMSQTHRSGSRTAGKSTA